MTDKEKLPVKGYVVKGTRSKADDREWDRFLMPTPEEDEHHYQGDGLDGTDKEATTTEREHG